QTSELITASDLFSGRLEKHGVREIIDEPKNFEEWAAEQGLEVRPGGSERARRWVEEEKAQLEKVLPPDEFAHVAEIIDESVCFGTTKHRRCLTDGTNYTWVKISKRGFVDKITRYGSNDPQTILKAIAQEFDTDIYSEHDAEFWEGYDCGP